MAKRQITIEEYDQLKADLKLLGPEGLSKYSTTQLNQLADILEAGPSRSEPTMLESAAEFAETKINKPIEAFGRGAAEGFTRAGLAIGTTLGFETAKEAAAGNERRRQALKRDFPQNELAAGAGRLTGMAAAAAPIGGALYKAGRLAGPALYNAGKAALSSPFAKTIADVGAKGATAALAYDYIKNKGGF